MHALATSDIKHRPYQPDRSLASQKCASVPSPAGFQTDARKVAVPPALRGDALSSGSAFRGQYLKSHPGELTSAAGSQGLLA